MKESEKDKWLKLGHIAEREAIAKRFQKEAGAYYAGGNDERAGHCRAIANELLLSAKQMRREYNEKYHISI